MSPQLKAEILAMDVAIDGHIATGRSPAIIYVQQSLYDALNKKKKIDYVYGDWAYRGTSIVTLEFGQLPDRGWAIAF